MKYSIKDVSSRQMKYEKNVDANTHLGAGYRWLKNWFSPYIRNKKVLDIGCWSGTLEKLFKGSGADVTGIDVEESPLVDARKLFPKYKFVNASVTEQMPFKKNSFDVVFFLMTIEHLPKGTELKSLKNINMVTKKKGLLFLSTINDRGIGNYLDPAYLMGHKHYKMDSLAKMLNKCGFEIIEKKVNGGFGIVVYTFMFYFYKHLLHKTFYSTLIDKWMMKEYNSRGFVEIKIRAQKVRNIA